MLKGLNDETLRNKKVTHDGCIFFIQRWTELTYPKTLDAYQYSILNTYVSLKECLSVAKNSLDGIYNTMDNLNDCQSELLRLLKEDELIKIYNPGLYNSLLYLSGKKVKIENGQRYQLNGLISRLEYCVKILDEGYHNWIQEELIKAIVDLNYSRIDNCTKILVSQCINLGWSIKGLFELHKFLLNKDNDDIQELIKFIRVLFSNNSSYDVYIKIKNIDNFQEFKSLAENFGLVILDGSAILDSYSSEIIKYLPLDKSSYYFAMKENARDAVSAALYATEHSKKVLELLTFYDKIEPWSLDGIQYYTVKNGNYVEQPKLKDIYGTYLYIESTNKIFESTVEIFSKDSVELEKLQSKLQGVFAYVNISKLSLYQEEKFLNLWIAIESFMNSGQYANIIAHVKKVLPAIMAKRYIYRLIRNLCEDCIRCSIELKLSSGEIDISDFSKHEVVERVIEAIKNQVTYNEITILIKYNKLLSYRFERIRELIINPKNVWNKIERYKDTISWHIQRLYRLRNEITHTSYVSNTDITPYVEHLHDFIAVLISEIVYITTSKKIYNANEILALLKDNYEVFAVEYNDTNKVNITGVIDMF